jgi:hypothetical protein
MNSQHAACHPRLDRSPQQFGLCLRAAVNDHIIRVSLERNLRMRVLHPLVEREVEEDVREQRTDDAPLRGSRRSVLQGAILELDWSLEPSLNIEQHPAAVRVPLHRPHHQSVIERVEEGLNVKIEYPVELPTAFPGLHGHERGNPGYSQDHDLRTTAPALDPISPYSVLDEHEFCEWSRSLHMV